MKKKIYFAGSIRAGRNDAELYHEMIRLCKEYGTVLTEHVGDLSKSAFESKDDRDHEIYEQDTSWLRESDFLIAECTTPSLGVGYELAYAEAHNVPVHVFYRKDLTQLSAMIRGDSYYMIYPYETREELLKMLTEVLEEECA